MVICEIRTKLQKRSNKIYQTFSYIIFPAYFILCYSRISNTSQCNISQPKSILLYYFIRYSFDFYFSHFEARFSNVFFYDTSSRAAPFNNQPYKLPLDRKLATHVQNTYSLSNVTKSPLLLQMKRKLLDHIQMAFQCGSFQLTFGK